MWERWESIPGKRFKRVRWLQESITGARLLYDFCGREASRSLPRALRSGDKSCSQMETSGLMYCDRRLALHHFCCRIGPEQCTSVAFLQLEQKSKKHISKVGIHPSETWQYGHVGHFMNSTHLFAESDQTSVRREITSQIDRGYCLERSKPVIA